MTAEPNLDYGWVMIQRALDNEASVGRIPGRCLGTTSHGDTSFK